MQFLEAGNQNLTPSKMLSCWVWLALYTRSDECHVADSHFFFISTHAIWVIKSPKEFGFRNTTKDCTLQMQLTNGPQLTGQTQKVTELGDPSPTFPLTRALPGAARAFKGLDPQAAPLSAPPGFHLAKPQLEPGTAPSPLEPSGKVWTCWQENWVLVCVYYGNRCEERSRSNCGCSDPIWLCPSNYKETVECGSFPPAELWRGKNTKFPGTETWH